MLSYVKITKENLAVAKDAFEKIFNWCPDFSVYYDKLVEGAYDRMKAICSLVYDENALVGITGTYSHWEEPKSAWLNWFGVLPEFRKNHYGAQIVKDFIDDAKRQGYKFARLYTEKVNNEGANAFYKHCGFELCEEYYSTEEMNSGKQFVKELGIAMDGSGLLQKMGYNIYSMAIADEEIVPWGDRSMHLLEKIKLLNTEQLVSMMKLTESIKK